MPDALPSDSTFNEQQLAARWGVSKRTLQSWRQRGLGPRYLKLGARIGYRHEDIERFERLSLRTATGARVYE